MKTLVLSLAILATLSSACTQRFSPKKEHEILAECESPPRALSPALCQCVLEVIEDTMTEGEWALADYQEKTGPGRHPKFTKALEIMAVKCGSVR